MNTDKHEASGHICVDRWFHWPPLRHHHNLPELFLILQPLVRGPKLGQWINPIDHRMQLATSDQCKHFVQLTECSHERAEQRKLLPEQVPDIYGSVAAGRRSAGDQ